MSFTIIDLRMLIFSDQTKWVAQGLEYDIGAQAPDEKSLQEWLPFVLNLEIESCIKHGKLPFEGINSAPKIFFDIWDENNNLEIYSNEIPLENRTILSVDVKVLEKSIDEFKNRLPNDFSPARLC